MTSRVYLDWNATAPLRDEARDAMVAALDVVGNPSSVHQEGRAAKAVIERARGDVASLVGCKPSEVVFTSGATEAAGVLESVAGHGAVMVDDTAHDALWSHFDLTHIESGNNVLAMGLANSETGVINEPPSQNSDGHWPYGAYFAASTNSSAIISISSRFIFFLKNRFDMTPTLLNPPDAESGRLVSISDFGRKVKHPAWVIWADAAPPCL